LLHPTLG